MEPSHNNQTAMNVESEIRPQYVTNDSVLVSLNAYFLLIRKCYCQVWRNV